MPSVPDLQRVIAMYRGHAGVRQKASLALVSEVLGPSDWISGPGDDAAAVPLGGEHILAAGEAMWPPFTERDPYGAGIGAVVANVNDIAAMGGRCLGIVDTVVASEADARSVLEGLRWAADRYGVAVLGGHLTIREGPPSLSAFAMGRARALLAARRAAAGQILLYACSLEGRLREDFPFFPSFHERGEDLPGDIALLARVAETGDCVAAKDVSMAGLLGSLGMLLEPSGCGVTLDLDALPRPPGMPLPTWMGAFPSFGFLLCAPDGHAEACAAPFLERGLACAPVGRLDASGELRVCLGGHGASVADLRREPVTRLHGPV